MEEDLEKIEKLKEQLGNIASKIDMLVSMNETEQMKFMQKMRKTLDDREDQSTNFILLLVLIGFVFSVLVFFGYKLYKSLVEKDRKREEKRKMKQMKKKK